ncbi:MAG: hypothetical protein IPH66_14945 [Crocinitomicaceae bacterium]|nr:hypothetical protein [Crocinitomicaceae bacterium]
MDHQTELELILIQKKLREQFPGDGNMDINAILMIIGVQESGRGNRGYTKDDKMNLLHVAICTLLSQYGYYEYSHDDDEGWPHFKLISPLPHITVKEQEELIKTAIVNYFKENGFIAV